MNFRQWGRGPLGFGEGCLAFLLCAAWSFFLYWYLRFGLEGLQYVDHMVFMSQRSVVNDEWGFLWRVLSFDRVRVQGSVYLFRPGLGLYLWVLDQWRPFLGWWGGASLLLHGLVGYAVYFLLRTFSSARVSAPLTFIFLTIFSGNDAVLWRHISPYLWGVCFFALGLGVLGRAMERKERPRLFLPIFFFLLSSFFHENAAYSVAVVTGGLLLLLKRGWRLEWAEGLSIKAKEIALFFIVPFVYLVVNRIDFAIRDPHGSDLEVKPLFEPTLASFSSYLFSVITYFFEVLGSYFSAFLVPQINQAGWEVQKPLFLVVGILVSLLFLFYVLKAKKAISGPVLLAWWAGGYLFVLSSMLAAVRLGQIGFFYLGRSRYYQYLANFVLIVIFALIARHVLSQWRWTKRSKIVTGLVGIIVFNQMFFSYFRTQRLGRMKYPSEYARAEKIKVIATEIKEGECYAGAGDEALADEAPGILFFRLTCPIRPGTPVTGTELLARRSGAARSSGEDQSAERESKGGS